MFLEQLSLRRGLEHHTVLTNLLRCHWVSPEVLKTWMQLSPPGRHLGVREGGIKEAGEAVGPW